MSDTLTLIGARQEAAARSHRRRYVGVMMSMTLLDAMLHVVFFAFSGRHDIILLHLPAEIALLVAANIAGALWIYRPIFAFMRGTGPAEAAVNRLHDLPRLSLFWAMGIAIPYAAINFGLIPAFLLYEELAPLPIPMLGVRVLVWTVFFPTLIYFLAKNHAAEARSAMLGDWGVHLTPRNGTLRKRLIIAFAIAVLLPSVTIMVDAFTMEQTGTRLGVPPYSILVFDFVTAIAIMAVFVTFTARSLHRPLRALTRTMADLHGGNLDAFAPVQTDDEIGQLAANYNEMLHGLRDRETVRTAFGKFVNPRIAELILKRPETLHGDVRTATVLFTDIESFTTITESMSPQATIDLLNDYFSVVMEPVGRFGGIITNFTGDSLLAAFNVPEEDPDHAANAVRTALEIERLLKGRTFGAHGVTLRTRVGINTGPVVAGAVGATDRLGYTILGDTVNVAARLEQLNKQYDSLILVSEETAKAAGTTFRFEAIGDVMVKGRGQPIRAFKVLAND